jgi:hypothetical protein
MAKGTQRTSTASRTTAATPARQTGSAAGPCKLTAVAGSTNAFQAKATDMPISFSLLVPDGKTEFLSVGVYKAADLNNALPGQPTSFSGTAFTLNLQAGSYVAIVVVGALPSASPVWVTESCAGATKLDWIAVPGNTGGEFALTVV